jgi:hypothetical protein
MAMMMMMTMRRCPSSFAEGKSGSSAIRVGSADSTSSPSPSFAVGGVWGEEDLESPRVDLGG